jgi:kynureninase
LDFPDPVLPLSLSDFHKILQTEENTMSSPHKLSADEDPLSRFRAEFVIPTNRQMKAAAVPEVLRQFISVFFQLFKLLIPEIIEPKNNTTVWNESLCRNAVDEECVYLCGNSLGAMAKRSKELVMEELEVWATRFALHLSRLV